jgi:hypothetical protein
MSSTVCRRLLLALLLGVLRVSQSLPAAAKALQERQQGTQQQLAVSTGSLLALRREAQQHLQPQHQGQGLWGPRAS